MLRGEPPKFWTGSGKKLLVLRRIVAEYLEADGPGAFKFALDMCDKFHKDNCFSEFGLVADLVVHPSIYECEGRNTKKVGRDHLQEHCKVSSHCFTCQTCQSAFFGCLPLTIIWMPASSCEIKQLV